VQVMRKDNVQSLRDAKMIESVDAK
jgi:hypothetical protein